MLIVDAEFGSNTSLIKELHSALPKLANTGAHWQLGVDDFNLNLSTFEAGNLEEWTT